MDAVFFNVPINTGYYRELMVEMQNTQIIQKGETMKNKMEKDISKLAYSLEEAAQMLGVSKGHLRNENIRGKLQLLKSGRRTLITATEIQRYIAELAETESQTA